MGIIKRALTLILSAVLLLGGLVLGASATDLPFTDADQISNTEAVAVMNAVGVFQGSGGAFSPAGILTREQAAKIICYMLGGQEEAEAISADEYLFTDVASTRWSAPYIAYCVKNGILSGDGSGKFDPEAPLTGGAFAKMLLVALGYDPSIEGYTGSDWILNVASTALALGIAPQNMNLLEALNREDAAQMCYKTLVCDMVRYKSVNEIFTDRPAVGKVEGYYENDYNETRDGVQQFCEAYFPELRLVTAYDNFGRPGRGWLWSGKTVYYVAHTPVAILTSRTDADTLAVDLSGYFLRDRSLYAVNKRISNTQNVSFNANLNLTFVGPENTTAQSSVAIVGRTTADFLAELTGNGCQVELYADEKNVITDVVVLRYAVDTVTGITIAPGKIAYTVGGTSYLDYQSGYGTDTVVVDGPIKVGDTVTYTVAGGVAYLYSTAQVKGTLTAVAGDTLQISGFTYPLGSGVAGVPDLTVEDQGVFCLDQFGNVVDLRTDTRTTGYANVVNAAGIYTPADQELGLPAVGPAVTVTVVTATGSSGQYQAALHTLTAADLGRGERTAANAPAVRLEPGDVVIRNTDLLVYDASAGDATAAQLTASAAAGLKTVWLYVLEGNEITFLPLSQVGTDMREYTPYLATDVDVTALRGANVMDGYVLNLDSNTGYVTYDMVTGLGFRYGSTDLPQGLSGLEHAQVVVLAGGTSQGSALVVFLDHT